MWNKIKDKLFEIILGAVIIGLPVYFADNIVDDYVTKRVIKELKDEKYINEDIKEGRYIVVNKKSFNENDQIEAGLIRDLAALYNELSDELSLKSLSVKIRQSKRSFNDLEKEVEGLKEQNEYIEALIKKELKININIDDKVGRGSIVLNGGNKAISQLIKTNKKITIRPGNKKKKIFLKPAVKTTGGNNSSIGYLHKDDYKKLFGNTRTEQAAIITIKKTW